MLISQIALFKKNANYSQHDYWITMAILGAIHLLNLLLIKKDMHRCYGATFMIKWITLHNIVVHMPGGA